MERALRLARQRPKTLAPGPALEGTLGETLDSSPALSASLRLLIYKDTNNPKLTGMSGEAV